MGPENPLPITKAPILTRVRWVRMSIAGIPILDLPGVRMAMFRLSGRYIWH